MKIYPASPTAELVKFKFPGGMIRATKNGYVAQKSTPVPKARKSLLQQQYMRRFAYAGRMASNPTTLEYQTAVEMAKGTEQVPRDILSMAAMGRYYVITFENGLTARYISRPTVNDPLAIRDPAVYLQTPQLPWQGFYLSIGNGVRLLT